MSGRTSSRISPSAEEAGGNRVLNRLINGVRQCWRVPTEPIGRGSRNAYVPRNRSHASESSHRPGPACNRTFEWLICCCTIPCYVETRNRNEMITGFHRVRDSHSLSNSARYSRQSLFQGNHFRLLTRGGIGARLKLSHPAVRITRYAM